MLNLFRRTPRDTEIALTTNLWIFLRSGEWRKRDGLPVFVPEVLLLVQVGIFGLAVLAISHHLAVFLKISERFGQTVQTTAQIVALGGLWFSLSQLRVSRNEQLSKYPMQVSVTPFEGDLQIHNGGVEPIFVAITYEVVEGNRARFVQSGEAVAPPGYYEEVPFRGIYDDLNACKKATLTCWRQSDGKSVMIEVFEQNGDVRVGSPRPALRQNPRQ